MVISDKAVIYDATSPALYSALTKIKRSFMGANDEITGDEFKALKDGLWVEL